MSDESGQGDSEPMDTDGGNVSIGVRSLVLIVYKFSCKNHESALGDVNWVRITLVIIV